MVIAVLDALRVAGVDCWVGGGWGVDALAGRATRRHSDLDLLVDEHAMQNAVAALRPLGFWEWYEHRSDRPLFSRLVLHDHQTAGHAIDLHPIDVESDHGIQFSSGSIDGRAVPCLSAQSQLLAHRDYRKRWRDRVDLATLRRVRDGSVTALIVPVSAADPLLDDSAREAGMPPHITVLFPFLRSRAIGHEAETALESVLEARAPFDFAFTAIGRFPNVVYLAPEPAQPFIELVEAVVGLWPDHQPYGGVFAEVVPHLTVAYGDSVPSGVRELLPLSARAEEVWLMSRVGGAWGCRRRFQLGGRVGRPAAGAHAGTGPVPSEGTSSAPHAGGGS